MAERIQDDMNSSSTMKDNAINRKAGEVGVGWFSLWMAMGLVFAIVFALSHLFASRHVDANLVRLYSEISPWLGIHFADARRAASVVVIVGLLVIGVRFFAQRKTPLRAVARLCMLALACTVMASGALLCSISLLLN